MSGSGICFVRESRVTASWGIRLRDISCKKVPCDRVDNFGDKVSSVWQAQMRGAIPGAGVGSTMLLLLLLVVPCRGHTAPPGGSDSEPVTTPEVELGNVATLSIRVSLFLSSIPAEVSGARVYSTYAPSTSYFHIFNFRLSNLYKLSVIMIIAKENRRAIYEALFKEGGESLDSSAQTLLRLDVSWRADNPSSCSFSQISRVAPFRCLFVDHRRVFRGSWPSG